jgi:hypothetical protein
MTAQALADSEHDVVGTPRWSADRRVGGWGAPRRGGRQLHTARSPGGLRDRRPDGPGPATRRGAGGRPEVTGTRPARSPTGPGGSRPDSHSGTTTRAAWHDIPLLGRRQRRQTADRRLRRVATLARRTPAVPGRFQEPSDAVLHWFVSFVGRGRSERTVTLQQVLARCALRHATVGSIQAAGARPAGSRAGAERATFTWTGPVGDDDAHDASPSRVMTTLTSSGPAVTRRRIVPAAPVA